MTYLEIFQVAQVAQQVLSRGMDLHVLVKLFHFYSRYQRTVLSHILRCEVELDRELANGNVASVV